MKSYEEIMEILEAFDLTRSLRDAGEERLNGVPLRRWLRAALIAQETVPAGRIHSVGWPVISAMRSKSWS